MKKTGNPALYRAILSHPPNTINGRFRVTEQGEMITQNYGNTQIAEHTLDIYTAAVMREAFTSHIEPKMKWREQMERISEVSCNDYRYLVREEPRFVPYFRQATPELELATLKIGSRPAKRNPKGGIESLRAIPWTFAWTQTRTHLSAWLGVGAGLSSDVSQRILSLFDHLVLGATKENRLEFSFSTTDMFLSLCCRRLLEIYVLQFFFNAESGRFSHTPRNVPRMAVVP